MRRWILLLLGVSVVSWCGVVEAQLHTIDSNQRYLFLLDPSSPELSGSNAGMRNVLHTYDPAVKAGVPVIDSLAQRLTQLTVTNGTPPLVTGFSLGQDQSDLAIPHGTLPFTVDVAPGRTGGQPGTALSAEAIGDAEADVYATNNTNDMTNRAGPNDKAAEENSGVATTARVDEFGPGSTTGLHGKVTGKPVATNPSKIIGFDYHRPTAYTTIIYFVIDAPFTTNEATPRTFYPSEVLRFDASSGDITVAWNAASLGLDQQDEIDAISVDMDHSAGVGQDPVVLYSLKAGSHSLACGHGTADDLSGADIFRTPDVSPSGTCTLRRHLYRTAFASGADPGDADISSITSIDPNKIWSYHYEAELKVLGRPLDEMIIVTDEPVSEGSFNKFLPGDDSAMLHGVEDGRIIGARILGSLDGEPVDAGRIVIDRSYQWHLANPAHDLEGLHITGTNTFQWTWQSAQSGGSWMTYKNGNFTTLSTTPHSGGFMCTTTEPATPGAHYFELYWHNGTDRSGVVQAVVFIDSPVGTPRLDEFTTAIGGSAVVDFAYDMETTKSVEVRLGSNVEIFDTSATYGTVGYAPLTATFSALQPGVHKVELTAFDGLSGAGLPSETLAEVGLVPRQVPGTVTVLDWPTPDPVSIAHWTPTTSGAAPMFVVARQNEADFYDEAGGFVTTVPAPPGTSVRGITIVGDEIFWTIEDGGSSHIVHTNAGGLVSADPLTISGTLVGDICVDGAGAAFWIVDPDSGRYRHVDNRGAPVVNGSGPRAMVGSFSETARAVAADGDHLWVPYEVGGMTTAFVKIGPDSRIVEVIDLSQSIGSVTGAVHVAEDPTEGIPMIYAVVGSPAPELVRIAAGRGLPSNRSRHHEVFGGENWTDSTATTIQDAAPGVPGGPDAANITDLPLVVSAGSVIGDIEVEVTLDHDAHEQLTLELVSPAGPSILLDSRARLGGSGELTLRYDDLFSPGFADGTGTRATARQDSDGELSLALLDGTSVNGTWTLRVTDHVTGGVGSILSWTIHVTPADDLALVARGDVDGDGYLGTNDSVLLGQYLTGSGFVPNCIESMDYDRDGDVDGDDQTSLDADIQSMIGEPICTPEDRTDQLGCLYPNCP